MADSSFMRRISAGGSLCGLTDRAVAVLAPGGLQRVRVLRAQRAKRRHPTLPTKVADFLGGARLAHGSISLKLRRWQSDIGPVKPRLQIVAAQDRLIVALAIGRDAG